MRRVARTAPARMLQVILSVVIVVAVLCPKHASAQLPPRFYWKSLTNSNAIPLLGLFFEGNANPLDPGHTVVPDANFKTGVVLTGYARTFPLFGRAAMAALLVPVGRVSGGATVGGLNFSNAANGFGDPLLEIDINVVGPKAVRNIPDLMRYEPGFSLDIIADIVFPIGQYDSAEVVNLGQNRWYGRIGAPIVWQLGPWIPGRRTTLEFVPSVWFFGDNNNYVGQTLSTKPMLRLETHVTRDLIKDLWVSLDATWAIGGTASFNGVEGEMLNNFGLGFTFGYEINEHIQLTFGYKKMVVSRTDLDMNGFLVSFVAGWNSLVEGMNRLEGE